MATTELMKAYAGPSKYDGVCTAARIATQAEGAILIILGGSQGSGFAVQMPRHTLAALPRLLRELADGVEQEQKERGET